MHGWSNGHNSNGLLELKNRKQIHTYLDGLYNTVVLNDIVERKLTNSLIN